MSLNPNYQRFDIDLSQAGQQQIYGLFSYLHMTDARGAGGVADLDAIISVKPRRTGGDFLDFQINSRLWLPGKTDYFLVQWDAQPGVVATIVVSDHENGSGLELDTPATKQLVTTSIGTTLTQAAVTVGLTPVLLAAGSASRQSVLIKNNGAVPIYVGAAGVTTANGFPLDIGQSLTLDKSTADIYAISGTAGQNVRVIVEA